MVDTASAIAAKAAELSGSAGAKADAAAAASALPSAVEERALTLRRRAPSAEAPVIATAPSAGLLDAQVSLMLLEVHVCDRIRPPPVAYSSVGLFSTVQLGFLVRRRDADGGGGGSDAAPAAGAAEAMAGRSRFALQLANVRAELRHATSAAKILNQPECRITCEFYFCTAPFRANLTHNLDSLPLTALLFKNAPLHVVRLLLVLEPCMLQSLVDTNAPPGAASASDAAATISEAAGGRTVAATVVLCRPTVSDADAAERSVTARIPIQQLSVLKAMVDVVEQVVAGGRARARSSGLCGAAAKGARAGAACRGEHGG